MYIERRKAYIEFLSDDTVIITTPLRQKTFNLKKDRVINLIDFSTNGRLTKFCAVIKKAPDVIDKDPVTGDIVTPEHMQYKYWLEIMAETSKGKITGIGMMYPKDGHNKQTHSVNLKVE